MSYFVTLEDFTPGRRFPPYDTPWTDVRIEEASPLAPTVWWELETQALDPLDPDPTGVTTPLLERSVSTPLATLERGLYRLVFLDADGNMEFSDVVGPRSGYPGTGELVAQSSVAELTGLTDPEQDALRDVAIESIEQFCGQRFEMYEGELVVDGSGARELFAPQRIVELTAIIVKGTSLDLTDIVVSPEGDRIHFAAWNTSYAVAAMRETAYDSRTFRAGTGMVVLTGIFGWPAVPAAVAQAIRIEMEEQALADANPLSGTVATFRRLGLRNISQGNLRANIGNPAEVSPRAARLLAKYVWTGAGGQLV